MDSIYHTCSLLGNTKQRGGGGGRFVGKIRVKSMTSKILFVVKMPLLHVNVQLKLWPQYTTSNLFDICFLFSDVFELVYYLLFLDFLDNIFNALKFHYLSCLDLSLLCDRFHEFQA